MSGMTTTCQGYKAHGAARCDQPATHHVTHPQRGDGDYCNRHAVTYKRMERNGFGYSVTPLAGEGDAA